MKPRAFRLLATIGITVFGMTVAAVHALEPPPSGVIKANNALNLDQGSSWVNGAVPQSGEIAVWDATVTTANTTALGVDPIWSGIRVTNPGGLVTINGGVISLGDGGIDMASATTNLVLNTAVQLNTWQEWNIATGRTVTVNSGVYGDGQILTKTGGGITRVSGGARFQSLNILGGSLAILSGTISTPGGVTLGTAGAGASNPTLSLSQPQSVPQLFVAAGTSGARLELGHNIGSMNLSSITLYSPLTIRRSLPSTSLVPMVADAPIFGGTTAGTDALILSAVSPISPTIWVGNSAEPNSFSGNVRFTSGLWTLQGNADTLIPDASLVTITAPAQVTMAVPETIDGLAGTGRLTGSLITVRADNLANEGAREFSGTLTKAGTTPFLIFGGSGTQVLSGGAITYGGTTTINSGTLVLRDTTAFASNSVTVAGGRLELQSTTGT